MFCDQIITNGELYHYGGAVVRPALPGWAAVTGYEGTNNATGFRAFVGADGLGVTGTAGQMFVGSYSAHPVGRFTAAAQRMTITAAGNVGIGTASPGFLLEVNGSAGKPGGGSWSVASDERLKKNIRPLAGALGKLLALHGVSFEFIDPAKIHELSGERMGLLAQEAERVFPRLGGDRPGRLQAGTVRGLEALMVEALRLFESPSQLLIPSKEWD